MNYHEWQHEQWREHQRRSLDITDEQLDCLLEVASAAAATGGGAGYSELVTGIMMMSMSAGEIATIAGAVAAVETEERQMTKRPTPTSGFAFRGGEKGRELETGCGTVLVIIGAVIAIACAVALVLFLARVFGLW